MAARLQWARLGGHAAARYERDMVPAIFAGWADELLARVPPGSGDRVLDLACGTGILARRAAGRVGPAGSVTGLDLSPAMLAAARAAAPDSGITWQEGSAVALPFADATFDLVLCQQGLQFFPDRPAALREVRRVLRRDGRVGLAVFRASAGHLALSEALPAYLGAEAAASICEPMSLTSADELFTLLAGAGFRDVTITRLVRPACFAATEAFFGFLLAGRLAELVSNLSDEARERMLEAMQAALGPFVEGSVLTFPMESHLVAGRA
jgi:SAM-dependent methyltransferase